MVDELPPTCRQPIIGMLLTAQCLRAGLLDEIHLHVANVLLGAGRPLFEHIGTEHVKLERTRVIATPSATHLSYRVLK